MNTQIKIVGVLSLLLNISILGTSAIAQTGTWTPVASAAPDYNHGVMILMTDGSVLVKTSAGGDYIGNIWDKLTPDIHGSYVNGTWTTATSMWDSRLYFSAQILKNGNLYIAGGEYGTGRVMGEVYDPILDYWNPCPRLSNIRDTISDANSEILPDGRILQAIVSNNGVACKKMVIYNPDSNTYVTAPSSFGYANESAWVKLQDNSILFVDIYSTKSERYIPATNTWIHDADLPVGLYDPYGYETGAGLMLPDGRVFFIGSSGYTAYYTPSGSTSPGSWIAGPMIPHGQGTPDAAAAMMANGKILCAVSDTPYVYFPTPDNEDTVIFSPQMTFYEFDYITNSFSRISAPDGNDSLQAPSYFSNMLCLPDGSILYSSQGDDQYYVYTPGSVPLSAGKPAISNVIRGNCDTLTATGTLFNGITEGAGYGDDWQMATNYPVIRFSRNDTVYYARTFNWNSTGIMRGGTPDTTQFMLPKDDFGNNLMNGTYNMQVIVNGNASDVVSFSTCVPGAVKNIVAGNNNVSVYPNPASGQATVVFNAKESGEYYITLTDLYGRVAGEHNGMAIQGENKYELSLNGVAQGMYTVSIHDGTGVYNTKMVVR